MADEKGLSLPATGVQLHAIAKYCGILGIKRPLEENKMTRGEAGRMVRLLKQDLKRKKEKRGTSSHKN